MSTEFVDMVEQALRAKDVQVLEQEYPQGYSANGWWIVAGPQGGAGDGFGIGEKTFAYGPCTYDGEPMEPDGVTPTGEGVLNLIVEKNNAGKKEGERWSILDAARYANEAHGLGIVEIDPPLPPQANGHDTASNAHAQARDDVFDAMVLDMEIRPAAATEQPREAPSDAAPDEQTSNADHDSERKNKANGEAPEFDDPPPLEAYANEPKANGFKKQTGSDRESRGSTAESGGQDTSRGNTSPDDGAWKAPLKYSYGASFDPSKIPLRRWILGNRRALGEVTCDAGPPGVNKSTLQLSDAVQIVTGRKILDDEVHMQGEVLYLAGEDARRDVEARIAGILQRYNIKPAELDDKLHVIYLDELENPSAYSLAHMEKDLALLNVSMTRWLRELPNVVAIFIDPIVAWHTLIENSNDALPVLMQGMRSMAVRGKRHVGFDHHVTKASMGENTETHVGNLAALRGAGAIGGGIRWGFTLAKINAETALRFGVLEDDRWQYRRLDPLKASYGPDGGDPRMLKVEGVRIANGEHVGVLVEVDLQQSQFEAIERKKSAEEEWDYQFRGAIVEMLESKGPCSSNEAARWFVARRGILFPNEKTGKPLGFQSIRGKLQALVGEGLDVVMSEKNCRRPNRVILRDAPRNSEELAFEDSPATAKAKDKATG